MIYVLEPWPSAEAEQQQQIPAVHAEPASHFPLADRPTSEPVSVTQSEDAPDLASRLKIMWQRACTGDTQTLMEWRREGGRWEWQKDGVVATTSGVEWSNLEWQPWHRANLGARRNFVIEVTVSGKAEAAGLSFGPYKDFLSGLSDSKDTHRLQLEVDADAQRWALRVDGQLQNRCWWDAAVHGTEDLLDGVLTLKARHVQEIRFQDLALHHFRSSCKLSVIITCRRFVQRLRLALHNRCHSSLPHGALELLVVNPQSPDGTHEYLAAVSRSYPHLRVRELEVPAEIAKNKGAMINRAVTASSGEWIWLTDADCLFAPESAAIVLQHVAGHHNSLFYGQRRYLSAAQTDALLSGRLDSLGDFADLAISQDYRPPENAPWGYTQIAHRSVFMRLRYSERLNHFAHSDGMFIEECRRQGMDVRQIPDLYCLHLDHPFAWYGAESFL